MISYNSILWLAFCVYSLPADSLVLLSVRVGSSAVLPCAWGTVLSKTPHVEWRTISETVFERRGGESYQGEGYKERVDVPEDMLLQGNCSLVLKEVQAEDAGVYESYLLVKRLKRAIHSERVFIQSVQLSVDDELPILDGSLALKDDAGMTCPFPKIILVFFSFIFTLLFVLS